MSVIDKQALEWVVRQAGQELERAQRAEFDAWYAADPRHRGAYLRALAIGHALDQITPDRVAASAPARRGFLQWGGLAAALALGAGITALAFRADAVEIVTAKGEMRQLRLADGSLAMVNSDSRITVSLGARQRVAEIARGEAWFEVARDPARPFIVEAGRARIRAVGTAFGVRRTDGEAEVLVSEGVVEVWNGDGQGAKRRVAAGEGARVSVGAEVWSGAVLVSADAAGVERKLAWRKGTLVFHNDALADAVADFNRYSRKQIVIADPALLKKTLVGQYQVDAPELFAQDVSVFLNVPVAVTADRIVIGAVKQRESTTR